MKKSHVENYLIGWLIGVIWILPFLGLFAASIRPYKEVVYGWWRLDQLTITLKSYLEAWGHPTAPMSRGIFNSIIISVPTTLLVVTAASLAAYALAMLRFKFKSLSLFIIIFIMAIPVTSIIPPLFFQMHKFRLINTRIGLILVNATWGLPWSILFLRNFFLGIPKSLMESGRIDGASDFTIYGLIIIPITKSALISVGVLEFVWTWNSFLFPLILLHDSDLWTATQCIPVIKGVFHIDWSLVSSAALIAMIFPLIIFVFLQKYYLRGMMVGSIKG